MGSSMHFLRWSTRFAYLLAALVLLFMLASGPVFKLGWVGFGSVFQGLMLAVPAGLIAMLLLLVGRLCKVTGNRAWLVMLLLAAVLFLPIQQALVARSVPGIHDISTDLTDPPRFSAAMVVARKDASNPPEYPGTETAQQQQQAYPHIQPLRLAADRSTVFAQARELVAANGWQLVQANPDRGIIEASDTSWWFGFVDDVIIRIQSDGSGSLVDMRSKSRIGRSDIGANAARIDSFLQQLQQRLTS
ncbi:MAG: hypothetical protein Tsb0027_13150 [Wenzhouxiangellaceae bacterium]